MAFARRTDNSENAIGYARGADQIVATKISECLKGLDTKVTQELGSLQNEKAIFKPDAQTKLHDMFNAAITKLQQDMGNEKTRIQGLAEDNSFIAPLEGVMQIAYNTSIAWYRTMDGSVNQFAEGAYKLLDAQVNSTQTEAGAAGTEALNTTPELAQFSDQI